MGERIRDSLPSVPRESPDERKQKLATLVAHAKEFNDLEQESGARQSLKVPEDEAHSAAFKRLQTELATEMPFIGEAIANPALIGDALKLCRELVVSMKLGPHIAERMADNAMAIKTHLEQYPEEVGPVMSLIREAYDVLSAVPEKAVDAAKLRDAFNSAGPALEILFSDANPASEENAVYRILLLTELLSMADERNARWMRESIGHHIAACVANNFYMPEATSANARKRLEKLAKKPSTEDEYKLTREYVETVLRVNNTGDNIRDILNTVLTDFGLPKDLHKELDIEAETAGDHVYNQSLVRMLDQLEYIQELEKFEHGAVGQMYEQFGIRWLSRYPKWQLIEQYKTRHQQLPYGILAGASADWNHKHFEENDREIVRSLAAQLKEQGIALRIIESANKPELQARFAALNRAYGEGKARFMLLRAHSDKTGVTLGKRSAEGEFLANDLRMEESRPIRACFTAGAPIVLDGCSIGRKGGFAQVMSEVLDTKVIAPPGVESTLAEITVRHSKGALSFEAWYEAEKGTEEVTPHEYISGRKR